MNFAIYRLMVETKRLWEEYLVSMGNDVRFSEYLGHRTDVKFTEYLTYRTALDALAGKYRAAIEEVLS